MNDDRTIIELESSDAAFVLREDGSHEVYLEIQDDEDEASDATYLMAGLSIAFVNYPEKLKEFVDQVFENREGD